MSFLAAHLPDARVVPLPVIADPIQPVTDFDPSVGCDRANVFVVEVERVHELTVNVRLKLRNRGVADAYRSRAAISLPVLQALLGNLAFALDRQERGKSHIRMKAFGGVVLDPVDEA